MITCTRGQIEAGLCKMSVKVPTGPLVGHHGSSSAAVAELVAKLVLTGIAVLGCLSILWSNHQIQASIKMCKRGDHSGCTPLSPWCPARVR